MSQTDPTCLAIIPARGGSKGVPRKNVRPLAGRPLIAWTIAAAREAKSITRVVVSTDDREIAQVAQSCGADIVWRPAEISGDTASSESALSHALDHLAASEDYHPDIVAFLQCTTPLTTADDIDGTVGRLLREGADSALSATRFFHFLWRTDDTGAAGINHDKRIRQRRQERQPEFLESGAVYAMRTPGFLESKHRFFGKTVVHEVPATHALEIDEPDDFVAAELFLRRRERARYREFIPNPVGALVMDFDGVLTDDAVLVNEDGKESVRCTRSDGHGLARLRQLRIPMLVISKETNPVVGARCRKLRVDCIQACDDKLPAMTHWLAERSISPASTIYVGNDVNDLPCLRAVGCPVAVADAHDSVKPAARIVLSRNGGQGGVRELCDMIVERMAK